MFVGRSHRCRKTFIIDECRHKSKVASDFKIKKVRCPGQVSTPMKINIIASITAICSALWAGNALVYDCSGESIAVDYLNCQSPPETGIC